MKRFIILAMGAALALTVGAGVANAQPTTKQDVCHVSKDGSYSLITVSETAVPAHLAKGGALPGDPYPGSGPNATFSDDCNLQITQTFTFGDGGWAGWSCPSGTTAVGGAVDSSTGPVAVSELAAPGSVYPHYTFGANESGWVVRDLQDGSGNTITFHVVCA